jgi:16S rRNA (guanine(527)-N(7))-methyltransferase RsmG
LRIVSLGYNQKSMDPARIAALLQPFLAVNKTLDHCHSEPSKPDEACPELSRQREPAVLSPSQLYSISTYIDILLRWNTRINLTAIRTPEEIVTRHFGESLFAARRLFPNRGTSGQTAGSAHESARASTAENAGERTGGSADASADGSTGGSTGGRAALQGRVNGHEEPGALAPEATQDQIPSFEDRTSVADVGSGAGFPGLPMKLWAPHISLTLIESNHKKCAFLREVARALILTDVNIQNTRAETLATKFDLVTLRAVERFQTILPTAASLVAPSGRLALLISSAQEQDARAAVPNLEWSATVPIPLSRSRVLAVAYRKP